MTWIQIALAVPAAIFVWTLIRDFLAGLDHERLWSDPEGDNAPAVAGGREWETTSCKIYEFQPPRSAAGGVTQRPLDREA